MADNEFLNFKPCESKISSNRNSGGQQCQSAKKDHKYYAYTFPSSNPWKMKIVEQKKNIGFLYQVVLQPLKMIVLPRPTKNGSKITQSSDSLSTAPQNCPWLTFDRKNLIRKYSFHIHQINISLKENIFSEHRKYLLFYSFL